eukprot:scaffold194265_cov33-Tisochrysis_lutea.AAC.3
MTTTCNGPRSAGPLEVPLLTHTCGWPSVATRSPAAGTHRPDLALMRLAAVADTRTSSTWDQTASCFPVGLPRRPLVRCCRASSERRTSVTASSSSSGSASRAAAASRSLPAGSPPSSTLSSTPKSLQSREGPICAEATSVARAARQPCPTSESAATRASGAAMAAAAARTRVTDGPADTRRG